MTVIQPAAQCHISPRDVSTVQALADEAQCLFLRLFLRKGPWFRLGTLSYSELTDTAMAAEQLCQAGMATPLYPSSTLSASFGAPNTDASPISAEAEAKTAASTPGGSGQEGQGCSLGDTESCTAQLVCEVAEALTVAELQLLMGKLELGSQGRTTGISKSQMLQLLKGVLEKVEGSPAEVGCLADWDLSSLDAGCSMSGGIHRTLQNLRHMHLGIVCYLCMPGPVTLRTTV